MKKFYLAIIGGGFSGLCLAAMLGQKYGNNIAVIEGNKRVGKKILATGNGQGNITNSEFSISFYHGDVDFAEKVLNRYKNRELLDFFESIGLIFCEKEGKIYPASMQAGAICDVLRYKLSDENVEIFTENYVTKIKKVNDFFEINCENGNKFFAKNVALAFGGKSGAGFLTDGRSYTLAQNFGHTLTSLSPSLVQIKTEREKIKGLKGIKQEAKVGLYADKTHICTFSGDILFTDYGLSGNAIFSLSAYLKGLKNPRLEIEFLSDIAENELLEKLVGISENITLGRLLLSILQSRLALAVLKEATLNAESPATKQNIEKIVKIIKKFTLKIEGTLGFESSQVTAGGIKCGEIYPDSMQSKLEKGLYIIGEALNVDGNCGGYNLQWAYSSAAVAAKALSDEKN